MANSKVQAEGNGLSTLSATLAAAGSTPSHLQLAAENAEPEAVPQLPPAPQTRRRPGPTARFNRVVKVLYGEKSSKILDTQAKEQLWTLLDLVADGKLSCEQTTQAVTIFRDARAYGDLDADLKAAFADIFLDCYEVKVA